MEIKLGNLDLFEDGWFEAVRALAIQKLRELGYKDVQFTMDGCGDDEAMHFKADGKLFHLCYSDPTEAFIVEEIRCEKCGAWIPANVLDVHKEVCGGEIRKLVL